MDVTRILIHSANQIVTPMGKTAVKGLEMNQLKIINNGAVLMEDGIIIAVGETPEVLKISENLELHEVIDASNKIVMPGFVDSHTHFVFAGDRMQEYMWRLEGQSYMDILAQGGGIINSVKSTQESSLSELVTLGFKRLNNMLSYGVTSVEGKSGYGLNLETELMQLKAMQILGEAHPLTVVPTFMAAHAVPPAYKGRPDDYIDLILTVMLPEVAKMGLADFCDVFCEKNVFTTLQSRKLLQGAKDLGLGLKIHADEVVNTGGAGLAAELKAISADHLLMASHENLLKMKENNVIATLLPMTAFSLKESYADVHFMMQEGLAVALATDFNPGSCFSESIPLLIALATRQMGMSIEAAITALTLNGAAAIGLAQSIGSIEVGKNADVVIHDCPHYGFLAYHLGANHVVGVIKNGEIAYQK